MLNKLQIILVLLLTISLIALNIDSVIVRSIFLPVLITDVICIFLTVIYSIHKVKLKSKK